ncbi:MAG: hypothetical protein AB2421_17740, partial [Thermotaleaceae bacterium]
MKRLWIYLCILSVILNIGCLTIGNAAADDTEGEGNSSIPVETEQRQNPPNLVVGRGLKTPVFKAGEEVRLSIPIDNTSTTAAEHVVISLVVDNINDLPFSIDNMTAKKRISSIGGRGNSEAVFYLNIPKTVAAKIYGMTINVEYSSPSGGSYSASEKIYIKIENDYKMPELRLLKVEIDGDELLAGSSKRTLFRIENTGDLAAKDVEVRLGGFENNGLKLETPIDTQNIKSIEGKRQGETAFKILADKDIESGTYSLDLFLTYKDENN